MKWWRFLALVVAWTSWLALPIAALMSNHEVGQLSRSTDGTGSFPFCGNSIAEPLAFALNYAFPGMLFAGTALLWLSASRVLSVTHTKVYCLASAVSMTAFWFYFDWVFRTHFGDASRGIWWLP